MSDLHNESIFITGGGSGLGLALVERFIEEGAQVATLELSAAKVASLRQRFGEHILAVEGNVTCYADYQRAVDQILTRSGKLDCFIGNAGIWDQLFIATGAAARPLPLLDALGERCFTLRHAGDAARLREVLQPERSVVIVGAGTIGLELAASATQRRCKVTVIELAATVMGRNAPPPVQRYLLQRHQQAGVRILLNNAIEHVVDGEKVELTLQSGETLQADVVIYGIGISANEQLAREANLDTANGIVIDEACRTCDPAIFAGGDVAITRLDNGALHRCESWENANNQAQIAAAAMLGLPLPLLPPPWFWSDQYSDNLQFIGDMRGDDWLCRGNPETQKAIWFNLQNGVLIGAVTLNQGREIRPIRKWIQSGKTFDAKLLIDENIALKSL